MGTIPISITIRAMRSGCMLGLMVLAALQLAAGETATDEQHAVPLNDAATYQLTSIPLSGMSTGDVTAVGFSHKEKAIKAQLKQAEDVNTRTPFMQEVHEKNGAARQQAAARVAKELASKKVKPIDPTWPLGEPGKPSK